MSIEIREADFADPVHSAGIVDVLNSYAADPVGGATPLTQMPAPGSFRHCSIIRVRWCSSRSQRSNPWASRSVSFLFLPSKLDHFSTSTTWLSSPHFGVEVSVAPSCRRLSSGLCATGAVGSRSRFKTIMIEPCRYTRALGLRIFALAIQPPHAC